MNRCEICGRLKSNKTIHTCPTVAWNKGKKGGTSWNKGLKSSDETKAKLRASLKGITPWNKGTKGKQIAWNKGLHVRLNPSCEFKKGIKVWNKGLKGAMKPNKTSFKKGQIPINKGIKVSEAMRKKMSETTIKTALRGDKHPMWKGGITPLNHKIRTSFEYKKWRNEIFIRDNFTCVKCAVRGGKIHADHIKLFAQIMRENKIKSIELALECGELWNISNGQTLCEYCHRGKTKSDLSLLKRA